MSCSRGQNSAIYRLGDIVLIFSHSEFKIGTFSARGERASKRCTPAWEVGSHCYYPIY